MIAPLGNTQIWIAAGVTDLRPGFTGLSALVQTKLEQSPFSGQVFVFRGRRGLYVEKRTNMVFSALGRGARRFAFAPPGIQEAWS